MNEPNSLALISTARETPHLTPGFLDKRRRFSRLKRSHSTRGALPITLHPVAQFARVASVRLHASPSLVPALRCSDVVNCPERRDRAMQSITGRSRFVTALHPPRAFQLRRDPRDRAFLGELLGRLRQRAVDLSADCDLRGMHVHPQLDGHSRLDESMHSRRINDAGFDDSTHSADMLTH
jgi:hypothetical protein